MVNNLLAGDLEGEDVKKLDFEETELRLGLPGGGSSDGDVVLVKSTSSSGKRGFFETVDLKLKLSSVANSKELLLGLTDKSTDHHKEIKSKDLAAKPRAKAQVVGWPPVRSFRKNIFSAAKSSTDESEKVGGGTTAFVKVSMDGAPYLRKVDLKMYRSYHELSDALSKMFSSFTIGNCGSQGMKDFMNERKLVDLLSGSDYVPTYEDKDGDWMLVGDVPWEMFVQSCKRLRIMKGTEAIGLAPRAVEKCKNRN